MIKAIKNPTGDDYYVDAKVLRRMLKGVDLPPEYEWIVSEKYNTVYLNKNMMKRITDLWKKQNK